MQRAQKFQRAHYWIPNSGTESNLRCIRCRFRRLTAILAAFRTFLCYMFPGSASRPYIARFRIVRKQFFSKRRFRRFLGTILTAGKTAH